MWISQIHREPPRFKEGQLLAVSCGFCNRLAMSENKVMVPGRGLEPPRPCERQHLKLVRLPIPPSGHFDTGLGFMGKRRASGRRVSLVCGPVLSTADVGEIWGIIAAAVSLS